VAAAISGGESRTESMRNAMAALDDDTDIIVVHDAIRPLATREIVEDLISAIEAGADAAIPCWELPDTVKSLRPDGTLEHRGREEFLIAQGPSAYRYDTMCRMFATLAEIPIEETVGIDLIGGRVVPVRGSKWSQHVVDARDLELMAWLAEQIGP
jgi:2-C-methyl-D-erythritol 4-phosphate cytidylyltransferase